MNKVKYNSIVITGGRSLCGRAIVASPNRSFRSNLICPPPPRNVNTMKEKNGNKKNKANKILNFLKKFVQEVYSELQILPNAYEHD